MLPGFLFVTLPYIFQLPHQTLLSRKDPHQHLCFNVAVRSSVTSLGDSYTSSLFLILECKANRCWGECQALPLWGQGLLVRRERWEMEPREVSSMLDWLTWILLCKVLDVFSDNFPSRVRITGFFFSFFQEVTPLVVVSFLRQGKALFRYIVDTWWCLKSMGIPRNLKPIMIATIFPVSTGCQINHNNHMS